MSPTATTGLTGDLLVGAGAYRGTHGEIAAVDPRTGRNLEPSYGLGGPEDVRRAAELAEAAFDTYRETTPTVRAGFLTAIADGLDALGAELIARVTAETGIPAARVTGELARTTNQLRLFADVVRDGGWLGARIDPALPQRTPLPRPDIRRRLVPLGPVAVFSASNFPLAFSVAGGDTASALAAGAPVIVKAHSSHPGTSELVGRVIQRTVADHGLPEGVFSLLFGAGREVGIALVTDPRIRAVGFTGSRGGGLALVAAAQARPEPIPVYAEMSSVNPVIVLPAALRRRGAEIGRELVASMTVGQGQLCTSPGLVFAVNGPGVQEFVEAAAEALRTVPAAPMLSAGIQQAFTEGVDRLRTADGVQTTAIGEPGDGIAAPGQAHLFRTTNTALGHNPALREEVFGASSLIVTVNSAAELRDTVAGLEGQLTLTLHADDADLDTARALLPLLERKAGRIIVNGWPTGVEVGHAMVHGGPFPATSDARTTSVGTVAIERFLRPVAYQNLPAGLLPAGLADANPLGLPRRVDGR
ncbi:aldehyde dehydrogenase (NADP(+)) [Plantactinospora mayteni]|uniref:2,5-dioxovalerate dehydrogenase n=1 Tax=Plantactinospora mayteni TaxID=566021 RepID=A0ABQ4EFI1_9ACTN|nr:aldehyde dehydrogenase (NADP(+)) [Plantactinospora mayteni]GIG93486.1 2,5-dioxovalerate dehydrogenase [Plantactinospora mayteni]